MKRSHKIAILTGLFAIGYCCTPPVYAQDKKAAPKKSNATDAAAPQEKKLPDGFTLLPSGLEYKIVKHGKGTRKPQLTDHIEINIVWHQGDSVMFDSRKVNENKPVPLPCSPPRYKGDPMEGFMLMVVGDSAIFRLPVDSLKKMGGMQPWMKEGKKIEYNVTLVSLKTDAEEKKENAEKAAIQKAIDDKILQDYFAKNHIKPLKTSSGLYYTISMEGNGEKPHVGQTVNVNYTGMFLDGKKFDSNTDTDFHHTQPLPVEVGKGRVIKGWDEGLLLLGKGAKATFYIPSNLAYGAQERNPIPANAILKFDVEILNIEDAAPPAPPTHGQGANLPHLVEYFAANNIKATKTPSGLYYKIIQEGTGDNPKPGKKVTMKYLGKTTDGKVFDGNMDANFASTRDNFSFVLGVGQVIKGWDEGVALLKKGAKATLYIPSEMGYGPSGAAGGRIPPNADLIFDVEVVDIEQ